MKGSKGQAKNKEKYKAPKDDKKKKQQSVPELPEKKNKQKIDELKVCVCVGRGGGDPACSVAGWKSGRMAVPAIWEMRAGWINPA